jgi:hypothetical protein
MHFNVIKVYRQSGKINHELSDMILLTICGVLSEHDTWEGICYFGETLLYFYILMVFLDGIPSADTIVRVMGIISPQGIKIAII